MLEIEDYTGEYFFDAEDKWLEYDSILDDLDDYSDQDKEMTYNVFSLEQAISVLRQVGESYNDLRISAENAIAAIENFINDYTKECGEV